MKLYPSRDNDKFLFQLNTNKSNVILNQFDEGAFDPLKHNKYVRCYNYTYRAEKKSVRGCENGVGKLRQEW